MGVNGGEEEGARSGENDAFDAQLGGESVGPAEEAIGDDGGRRGRVGGEPPEERAAEAFEGGHDGEEGAGREILDVLGAGGEGGVGREGEDEGGDGGGRVAGEEGLEDREVVGGDDDGDGQGAAAAGEKVVGQV